MTDQITKKRRVNLIRIAVFVMLGLFLFGLKTCVYDHNKRLETAKTWCKARLDEYESNKALAIERRGEEFADSGVTERILLAKTPADGRTLPAEFSAYNGKTKCEIYYCLKVGLSRCEYDVKTGDVILVAD